MNDVLIGIATSAIKGLIQSGRTIPEVRSELRSKGLADEIIDEALSLCIQELDYNNQASVLVEEVKKKDVWYFGPNQSSSSHWGKLSSILKVKKGWSDEMLASLNEDSNAVVANLSNPKSTEINKSKGLVLGYVQSGKTANYSAVISKSLDAGYKFIIVLAGIHNNLRLQTEARLRAEIIEPSETSADALTKSDENGDFDGKHTQSANRILGGEKNFGIAVLKKNSKVLKKFNEWLSKADPKILKSTPVLIIDDESDQASINTADNPEKEQTSINKSIREIISKLSIDSYVGYTATPFANILINASHEDDLFPRDFIVTLKKPTSYVGAEELFGTIDSEGNLKGGLPLIRIIDQYDALLMKASKKNEEIEYEDLPESLIYAIKCFAVAGAIRIARGHFKDHISMLVHSSYKIGDQSKISELIDDQVRFLKVAITRKDENQINLLLNIKKEEFDPTEKIITGSIVDISDHDFENNLRHFLESFQVILDNSASDERLTFKEKFWGIIVGANTLSRGLTIEGLTTSYFIRSSKMYDSLMQMGRWFGYRPGYLDLKRIFITDELRQSFFEIASVENEIREEIKTMAEFGDRPIDLAIRIKQHPGMTVTARNKMKSSVAVEYSYSGRRVQPRYISLDEKVLRQNKNAVTGLLEEIKSMGIKKSRTGFSNFRTSLLYEKIKKSVILNFLNNYSVSKANKQASNDFIKKYLNVTESLKYINVAIMSQIREGEEFTFNDDDKVYLLNRSHSPEVHSADDPSAIYVRGLAIPRDEMIDMAKHIPKAPSNVDEVAEIIHGEEKGFSSIRRKYRPLDTALLIIYPINPKSILPSSGTFSFIPSAISSADVIFGIMLIFPQEENIKSGKYIANSSI